MDDEAVALEFAADVTEAVASVRELADSATGLADAAKGAADGCGVLTESAGELAGATQDLSDEAYATGAALSEAAAEAKAAAESAGDLAAAQVTLKGATAEAKAAVADLGAVQATAGKDSEEYAAALDTAAAAMQKQAEAAAQLAGVQEQQAAAAAQAKAAAEESATATEATAAATQGAAAATTEAATATEAAGAAQEGAAVKTDAASAGLGKYKTALLGVAIGTGVAVDGAVKYQAETTRLVTSAGESASQLNTVRQGMLALSSQTDQSTEQLSSGMYLVESAGFHGANGLTVLKAAAQGAKDEGAELSTVANGVTDALVDFHEPASDAANVTSQLIAGVAHGKTTFEEFSGSMSTILPLASSLHLSLSDVTGVLAEMTAHGMSARQAADDEANAMRELMKPNAAMVKEWGLMGITAADVNKKLSTAGLGGTLQWMSGIAQDGAVKVGQNYNQALGKMIGTAAGLQVALMTTGENAKGTNSAIHDIATASADAQGNVDGFATVSQTASFKLGAAKNAAEAMGISLGEALLPSVMAVIGPITSFLQLIASNQAASIAFALVIGGILAGALGVKLAGALKDAKEGITAAGEGIEWLAGKLGLATTATEAQTVATEAATVAQGELDVAEDANPIGLVIIAIVALIAVIVLVVTHLHWFANAFDIVRHAVATAGHDIASAFDEVRHTVASWAHDVASAFDTVRHDIAAAVGAVINWLKQNWKLILAILLDPVGTAVMEIRQHWGDIEKAFQDGWHTVMSFLDGLRHDIASAWDGIRHDAAAAVDGLLHDIASAWDSIRHDVAATVDAIPGDIEKAWDTVRHDAAAMGDDVLHDIEAAWNSVTSATSKGASDVLAFFEKLPGQVTSFLAALPGEMLTIGENVIKGLINGIVAAAASIPSIMSGLASDVASYFTDPLKLFSPSRLFFDHGWNIVQGAINGVKANASNLLATMRDLGTGVGTQGIGAASAVAPASGSTSVHVTVPTTVQGATSDAYSSPQFQQYMQSQVQDAVLRYAELNPTNGLTPAWGR